MALHPTLSGLVAGMLVTAPAAAEHWFPLVGRSAESTRVEVDLSTVRAHAHGGESVIRVTHDGVQFHPSGFGYRSFVATAQFDCARKSMSLASAAYFAQPAADGQRLGAETAASRAGLSPKLLESVPLSARQALLKAACATGHAN